MNRHKIYTLLIALVAIITAILWIVYLETDNSIYKTFISMGIGFSVGDTIATAQKNWKRLSE